jgi:hypothetical protein
MPSSLLAIPLRFRAKGDRGSVRRRHPGSSSEDMHREELRGQSFEDTHRVTPSSRNSPGRAET